MINIEELYTEITTDPASIGYAPHIASGADSLIAGLLNDRAINGTTVVSTISAIEAQTAVVGSEFLSLSSAQQLLWDILMRGATLDLANANIIEQIGAIWGIQSVTYQNLANATTKQSSRAEHLFGYGTTVSHTDVAIALRG